MCRTLEREGEREREKERGERGERDKERGERGEREKKCKSGAKQATNLYLLLRSLSEAELDTKTCDRNPSIRAL